VRRTQLAEVVLGELAALYPDAVCELDFQTPWQLLVATVLSAQCTDERVNKTTPELFRRWPDPVALAGADLDELEEVIRPTGFFRNKAANLQQTARILLADHDGEVPRDLDELVELPGVGRKTAKVVLGEAFGIAAGIAVDTHVKRLSSRIGLSTHTDPDRIAADLEELVPRQEWVDFSKRLILHGRRVCSARRPDCEGCALATVCARAGV
jgi:endonuclease-3